MAKIFYSTTHQRTAQPRSKRLRQLGTAASGASAGTAADGRITALQSLIDGNTTAINANTTAIAGNTAAIAENKTAIATNKSSIDDIKATLADWFTLEGTVLHTRYALASDDTVSSLGVGADGGGTGSGSGYGRLDSWDNYAPAAGDVLSATLGYDLLQRIENIQFPEVDLGGYYTAVKTDSLLAGKQDVISDLDDIRSGAALGAMALQSFTESDPVFKASAAATITSDLISHWNTAYGWGNHAAKGYLVASALDGYATEQWVTDKGYALQTALDETDQFLKELVEEFNTLNGTVSGHTTQIATINSALATHGNQITALGQLTTNHTTAIKNNTEDIETNTAAIAANKSSIDDIKATLADWFTLEGTVLHTRYALASDDTVSSLGVGTDSGGTGTGSANWSAVPTDIVPSTGGAYTLGTSDAPWKTLYVSQEIYAGSVPVVDVLLSMQDTLGTATSNIQGLLGATAAIRRNYVTLDTQQTITGTKYFDAAYFNNIPFVDLGDASVRLATMNDVPSITPLLDGGTEIARIDIGDSRVFLYAPSVNLAGYAKSADLQNLRTASAATIISGEGGSDCYEVKLYNGVADAYTTAIIPSYANRGFTSIESTGGVFLADDAMVNDILDYVDNAVKNASVNVDLSNYYTKSGVHTYVAQEINTFNENLATVATSGKYSDLSGKPTLGTAAAKGVATSVTSGSSSLVTSGAVYTALSDYAKQTSLDETNQLLSELVTDFNTLNDTVGGLATVATSGKYSDLSGIPTLGTAASKNWTGTHAGDTGNLVTTTWVEAKLAGYATTAVASTSANGLMSAAMVTKLNGIATGATAVTSSTVSGWGYTKNAGTVTSVAVKMNGSTKGTVTSSGTIDLGTVLTAHQSLAGYAKLSAQNTFTAHNSFNSSISVNGLLNANGGLDVYGLVRGFMSDTDSDTWSIDGDTGAASFAKVTTSGSINSKSTTSGQTVQIGHTSTTSVLQCIANTTGQTGKPFLISNATGSQLLIRTTGAGDGSNIGGDMTFSCNDAVNNEITGLWLCNKTVAPTKIAVLGPCLGTSMRTALDEYGSGVDIAGGLLAISSKETSYQNIHSAILDWDKSASTLYFKKLYKNNSGTWTTGAMNVDVSGNLSANSLDVTGDITCNGNSFRQLYLDVSDLSGYYNDLGDLAQKNSLSWDEITEKPTTLAEYGITDALKVTVPDATFPREVELDYDNINFKNALSVNSIWFNNGFSLTTVDNGNNLYYDGSVILSDWNYSNYALPLTGGTLNGWLDVNGDFTVTGNIHSYKKLTAEGGAEFVGRIGGLDRLGGNTVWEITSGGNAYLNGLHINPTNEESTYGGMISFGDEWGGMPYIAEESDDALTIHALNGLYISHDVYAVMEGDDWSTYWSIVSGYASFKGLSVMNRDDNEISYLGDTTSWIGTDLTAHGDLGVGGDLSVEGLVALNGNIRMTSATSPTIAFRYGNAASTTSQIQGGADNSVRLIYNMEVFTSSTNYKNHIQLNYNNTRIFRLNNSSSGMQYQYGTSASSVTTKGTFSTSGAYAASSDLTKKNILSYGAGFGVDEIAGAPIAYFTWKDLDDSRVNLGSIAQYWQHIAPECIYGTEGIDLTMDYSTLGLVSSIINARAIVRHESEIDTLKRRVKELEDKLAAYEAA